MNEPLYRGRGLLEDVTSPGITADDRKRIADYLAKPAHERDATDLVPDDRDTTDKS